MFAKTFGKRAALSLAVVCLFSGVRAAEPTQIEEDPLPVDSQWTGKLTQGGKGPTGAFMPPDLDAFLTVTHRNGNNFEAELRETYENLDITYLVRGTVSRESDKSLVIRFRNYGVKGQAAAGMFFLNVPYVAKFTGDALKGTWTYDESDSDVALTGTFQLKRNEE